MEPVLWFQMTSSLKSQRGAYRPPAGAKMSDFFFSLKHQKHFGFEKEAWTVLPLRVNICIKIVAAGFPKWPNTHMVVISILACIASRLWLFCVRVCGPVRSLPDITHKDLPCNFRKHVCRDKDSSSHWVEAPAWAPSAKAKGHESSSGSASALPVFADVLDNLLHL